MKFFLIVTKGKKRGLPIPIEVDLFMIGRTGMCQLRAGHDDIGEQHCAFAVRGEKVFLRDMGSGKATMVNGEVMPPSEEWPLHKGDRVAVGPLEFMINFREKQLNQRDLEEWALKQLDEDSGPKASALEVLAREANMVVEEDNASSVANAIIGKLNAAKGVVRGRLRISQEGPITIVRIQDVYLVDDAELVHLKKELHDNLKSPNLRVLLDFKNVRRMSTAAAEMFGEFTQWLRRQGSTLAMCRLRPDLKSMLEGLQSMYTFRMYADKDAAIAERW
jgi:anti-anti-sigma regulatory factor